MTLVAPDMVTATFEMREYLADGGVYVGSGNAYEFTKVHSGLVAVKWNASTTTGRAGVVYDTLGGATSHSWHSYIYFDTLPTANDVFSFVRAQVGDNGKRWGVQFNAATNRFRSFSRDNGGYHFGADVALTIVTGQYYRVSCLVQGFIGTNGPVMHATAAVALASDEVDVIGGQSADNADEIASSGAQQLFFTQDTSNAASNFVYYSDDHVAHAGGGAYPVPSFPLGASAGVLLTPVGDDTPTNGTSFTDDSGNSPPNPAWSRLDDLGGVSTDYIYQNVNDSQALFPIQFSAVPACTWVYSAKFINVHALNTAPPPLQSGTMKNSVYSTYPGTYGHNFAAHASNHTSQVSEALGGLIIFDIFGRSGIDPDSTEKANSLRHGHGGSIDTDPFTRLHQLFYEIEYRPVVQNPISAGGEEHERRPFPPHVAQWREHPWTMREHDGRR